jgi:hypothetical protein
VSSCHSTPLQAWREHVEQRNPCSSRVARVTCSARVLVEAMSCALVRSQPGHGWGEGRNLSRQSDRLLPLCKRTPRRSFPRRTTDTCNVFDEQPTHRWHIASYAQAAAPVRVKGRSGVRQSAWPAASVASGRRTSRKVTEPLRPRTHWTQRPRHGSDLPLPKQTLTGR